MKHWVYILISETTKNWSYVGSTSNLQERLYRHSIGRVSSTKSKRPLKCIYSEIHSDRTQAYKRELYLKSGIGREEKQKIITYSGIV